MKIQRKITKKELECLRQQYKTDRYRADVIIFMLGIAFQNFLKNAAITKPNNKQSLLITNAKQFGFNWMVCDKEFNWFVGGAHNLRINIEFVSGGTGAAPRMIRTLLAHKPKVSFALGNCGAIHKHKFGDTILCEEAYGDWPAAKYWLGKRKTISVHTDIDKAFDGKIERGRVYSISDSFLEREIIKLEGLDKRFDFIDMESYLYYVICSELKIPCAALLLVSDNINHETLLSVERLSKKELINRRLLNNLKILISTLSKLNLK